MTTIEKLKKQIEELKAEVERLKNEEALKRTEHYYFLNIDGDGDFYIDENDDGLTTENYKSMNYFLSEDSTEYFLSAIDELKKLQRLHEIYCPNFVPDWNNTDEKKWGLIFNRSMQRYQYLPVLVSDFYRLTDIYFDSEETAEKVCKRMNETL